jgi:hypothetical protein
MNQTHRSEVVNPPASAAKGAEAGNLTTEQRHGTGAVPRGAEARPADASPPPCEHKHTLPPSRWSPHRYCIDCGKDLP